VDRVTRALVVGGGSIGTRHARVLAAMDLEVAVATSRTDLDLPTFSTVGDAVNEFEPGYVVIATETARHAHAVRELTAAGHTGAVLIEKPLAVPASDLETAGFRHTGVGYNLRFHAVTRRVAELLVAAEVVAVEVYVGQHLSTWRPGREIATQYSAHAAAGGGVLRDLSHEFDYLNLLFGACLQVAAVGGRLTDLTVDSDDAWGVLARYERAPIVTTQLNYLAQPARRRITVTTMAGLVEADFITGRIEHSGGVEILEIERDDSYRRMHSAMLDNGAGVADVSDALEVERVIASIERSSADGTWVAR
jgi:predicted dehydrogenase